MFIIVFEDGAMMTAEEITSDDMVASDDGIISLIDISEAKRPLQYMNGAWHEMEKAGEQWTRR